MPFIRRLVDTPDGIREETDEELRTRIKAALGEYECCCALDCLEPTLHLGLPFCIEHMKDERLVNTWNELN